MLVLILSIEAAPPESHLTAHRKSPYADGPENSPKMGANPHLWVLGAGKAV